MTLNLFISSVLERRMIMNKSWASTVLTCVGAIGVVATAVVTAKATPKAIAMLKKAEEEKGEELTKLEIVKTAAPAYIPAILIGTSTIACVFGANILNKQHQASLASAYALLDNSYREYRKKVDELYGEDTDDRVLVELAKEEYEDIKDSVSGEKQLFFDYSTLRYFEASMDDVIQKATMADGVECYIISTPFGTDDADSRFLQSLL